jgi:hypothetical protein
LQEFGPAAQDEMIDVAGLFKVDPAARAEVGRRRAVVRMADALNPL